MPTKVIIVDSTNKEYCSKENDAAVIIEALKLLNYKENKELNIAAGAKVPVKRKKSEENGEKKETKPKKTKEDSEEKEPAKKKPKAKKESESGTSAKKSK